MLEQLQTLWSLFPQALLAGVVIAAVCSLLGVFVILKRVVFIGITLSEVAACGIAAGMIFGVHPYVGAGADAGGGGPTGPAIRDGPHPA